MWITPDGVPNTVALSDPTAAMQDNFVESITSLSEDDRVQLSDTLVMLEEELFETLEIHDDARPTAPADEHLPDGHLRGAFDSLGSIVEYLGQVEIQWRLDAFFAVQDLIDSLDDDGRDPEAHTYDEPYETVVDGETWVVRHRTNEPGTYEFDWVSGPNEGYGFTSYSPSEAAKTAAELDASIRDFLSDIDPETGYLRY